MTTPTMPPLRVDGTSDTAVARDLRSHLQMFDCRFDPATFGASWRLSVASRVADGVLAWWREQEIEEPLRGWDRRLIERDLVRQLTGVITSLLVRWIAELVIRLLIEWLWSPHSKGYRAATFAALQQRR